jgi:AcrR family transcriptional regulator
MFMATESQCKKAKNATVKWLKGDVSGLNASPVWQSASVCHRRPIRRSSYLTWRAYDVSMPKIIGKSLHEHRQMTRHKLFTALSTLADIAAAAHVGRTAVYNHFHDKEALLLGFITHETEQYALTLERALDGVSDPVEQLRTYIRQQAQLTRVFHLAPGPDLRTVLSRATQQRLREHADIVEAILRRILTAGIDAGTFPPQDIEPTVHLVNACLSGRLIPDEPVARERTIRAAESFVLRAVGARVPERVPA